MAPTMPPANMAIPKKPEESSNPSSALISSTLMKSVIRTPHPMEKMIIKPLSEEFWFIILNEVRKL